MPGHLHALLEDLRAKQDATRTRQQPRPLSPGLQLFMRSEQDFLPDPESPETSGILPTLEAAFPTEEELAAARGRLGGEGSLLPILLGGARRAIRETIFAPQSRLPQSSVRESAALDIRPTLDALKEGIARQRQAEEAVEGEVPLSRRLTSDVAEFGAALGLIPGVGKLFGAAVRPVGKTAATRVLGRSTKEAGAFGAFEAGRAGLAGDDLEEASSRVGFGLLAGATVGAAAGGGLEAVAALRASKAASTATETLGSVSNIGGGKPPKSGFVVANVGADGKTYYGKPGEIHHNLSLDYPFSQRGEWHEVGFAGPDGVVLSREQALGAVEIKAATKGTKFKTSIKGELDALDLREQASKVVEAPRQAERDLTWWRKRKDAGERGDPAVREHAAEVQRNAGLQEGGGGGIPKALNEDLHAEVARVYDVAESTPNDPATITAYKALAREVREQYTLLVQKGIKVEPVARDPYANSSSMIRDVVENKTLKVYTGDIEHPLLTPREQVEFRVVHDYYAHAGPGNPFGPRGEEGAFREHFSMLSPEAQAALATETRGQNSWMNFGPQSGVPLKDRPFAPQKVFLLPEHLRTPYGELGPAPERILAPAIKLRDGRIIAGNPGEIHGDVFRRLSPKDRAQIADESGFVTASDKFITRDEALSRVDPFDLAQKPDIEKGLHSTDLADFAAAEEAAIRRGEFADTAAPGAQNRIIDPRTSQSTTALEETRQAAREVSDIFFQKERIGQLTDDLSRGRLPGARLQEGKPGDVRGLSPSAKVNNVILKSHTGGGGTTHAVTGVQPTEGFAVSPYKAREKVLTRTPTEADINAYREANSDLLSRGDHFLGTWDDKETGRHVLDVVRVLADQKDAMRLGRAASQDAIRDLAGGKDIVLRAAREVVPIPLPRAGQPKRIDRLFESGREGADWYEGLPDTVKEIFGNDRDANMFMEFLAATSQATKFTTIPTKGDNVNLARRAFAEWKAGEPFGTRGSFGIPHKLIVQNLKRAANDIPLSGPKINPFASALRGDKDAIVIDRHINRAFGFTNPSPTPRQRAAIERAIRAGARRHGITNRQFQAAVWEGQLRKVGKFDNPAESIGRAGDVFPGGLPEGFRPNVGDVVEARVGRFKNLQEFLDAAIAGIGGAAVGVSAAQEQR